MCEPNTASKSVSGLPGAVGLTVTSWLVTLDNLYVASDVVRFFKIDFGVDIVISIRVTAMAWQGPVKLCWCAWSWVACGSDAEQVKLEALRQSSTFNS